MNDTYPQPARKGKKQPKPSHLTLAHSFTENDFDCDLDTWEERVFRGAAYFNVVRFGSHNGSEIKTVETLPQALAEAGDNKRALIYGVCLSGRALCIPRKAYAHYAQVWLETHPKG